MISNNKSYKDKTNSSKENINLQGGRIPPQALELEEDVLGAILLDKSSLNEVIDFLQPESFYNDSNAIIYESIMELFAMGKPVDIITVTQNLRKKNQLNQVGGAYYISQLTNRVASAGNVEHYARIISEKHILRELIRVSNDIITKSYDQSVDVFDLLDKAESNLFEIAERNLNSSYKSIDKVLSKAIDQLEETRQKGTGITGVPTGFKYLDEMTSGWQNSDMIVLAARPGMGKTAFVLSMARNAAIMFDKSVAIFSLEMSSIQLVNRLISAETEIPGKKLVRGNLEEHEFHQLHAKIGKLSEAKIFIDDTAALNIFEFRAKSRRLKAQHNIDLIVIDYLQLMSGTSPNGKANGNREQEISFISRSIKGVAKELNIPIIALSQLSRSVEVRGGDKRPILSDLRESGAIEQDADMVSFIYRPEYYGITEDADGNSLLNVGEVIIAKHRNGSQGTVKLRFIGEYIKFANLDDEYSRHIEYNDNNYSSNDNKTFQSKMNNDEFEFDEDIDDLSNFRNEGFDEEPPF